MVDKSQKQKEIVDSLEDPSHGLLQLAPRIGKTKIAIDILKKEKIKKVLWVTPSTKLRDFDIPMEFQKWKAKTLLNRTTIICYASLEKHKGEYDKIILDEYQDITLINSSPLFNGNIKYNTIIGLSGTHPKHKEKNEIYDRLGLKVLASKTIDEAVNEQLIAPYNITVINCQLDNVNKTVKAGNKEKPFMQTEYDHYKYLTDKINRSIFHNGYAPKFSYLNRMRFIYNLKSKTDFAKKFISNLEGRTLVFSGGIEQAEKVCINTYHSKTNDVKLQSFIKGKIDTLCCVNSGGIGYTFENVDNLVIIQVNSDSKGDATQKIARSLVMQSNYVANIYILNVVNTVDEVWKDKVLLGFNSNNIKHVSYMNYE